MLLIGGMGGAGGSGAGSAMGGAGGTGGTSGPVCGNGVIEQGEECDAGGDQNAVGCTDTCEVDCAGANEHEDPTTHACYRISTVMATWDASRMACQTWGGELVAFGTAAEKTFVTGFVTITSWIGANDKGTEGTFVWSNGEPFQYTDWDAGEPSASDCVRVRGPAANFKWLAVACTELRQSVCERKPPGAP